MSSSLSSAFDFDLDLEGFGFGFDEAAELVVRQLGGGGEAFAGVFLDAVFDAVFVFGGSRLGAG